MCKSQCFQRAKVRTKTTEGQYSPLRPEQLRLVSILLIIMYMKKFRTSDSLKNEWFLMYQERKIVTRVQINECCENLRLLLLFVMYIINE